MGPRYTKAIIMLVVGSPVLAAGIVIENSIETSSARSSTVTIARLMIAAGACMVAIGVFICCIIVTTNKKEEPSSRQPSTDVQLHRVRVTTAPHSQSQQRGVQLVTYSPLPEAQNAPCSQASRFSRPQVVNSPPVVHFQSPVVSSTPGGHHHINNNHNTNNNPQSGVSATQNQRPHPKASSARNQGSKGPAPQTPNAIITQNQRVITAEAKNQQQQNVTEAKTPQRSSVPEPKSQRSSLSASKSQSSNLSEAKSQRSNVSETKSQRSNVSETKSQRSNVSESKSQRSNVSESKSQRSSASEGKSQRSEAKSQRSSASETKSQRSSASETKSQRSSSSESKNHRLSASEAKCHRSSASEAKCHRSSPSSARSKRSSNPSATPGHRLSTSVVDSADPAHCTSTPKTSEHHHGLSSENLIYPVNAIDMAKLLTAAKKVMEPKLFDDIAKTYSIVYSPASSASQELPAGDLPPVLGQVKSSLSSSAGQLSQPPEPAAATAAAAACHGTTSSLAKPTEDQLSSQATLPMGSSPSAPPYQGPPPEFDPPPYHP